MLELKNRKSHNRNIAGDYEFRKIKENQQSKLHSRTAFVTNPR